MACPDELSGCFQGLIEVLSQASRSVQQNSDVQWDILVREKRDILFDPVLIHFEVLGAETGHKVILLVGHSYAERDYVGPQSQRVLPALSFPIRILKPYPGL